jgi:hypothetical protein
VADVVPVAYFSGQDVPESVGLGQAQMIDAAAAAMSCEELRDGGGCTDVQKKNAHGLIGESLD